MQLSFKSVFCFVYSLREYIIIKVFKDGFIPNEKFKSLGSVFSHINASFRNQIFVNASYSFWFC